MMPNGGEQWFLMPIMKGSRVKARHREKKKLLIIRAFCKSHKNYQLAPALLDFEAMFAKIFLRFAAKRVILPDTGRITPIILSSRPIDRSTYQLEQLVGEQGDDTKHKMKTDFRNSSHHHVAGSKRLFQPAVEPLRHGSLPVAHRLMGGQGDHLLPAAIFVDDGDS